MEHKIISIRKDIAKQKDEACEYDTKELNKYLSEGFVVKQVYKDVIQVKFKFPTEIVITYILEKPLGNA